MNLINTLLPWRLGEIEEVRIYYYKATFAGLLLIPSKKRIIIRLRFDLFKFRVNANV